MKKAYSILLVALGIVILSWFLPWIYSIVFPVGSSDPLVAFSPVSKQLIISETGSGNKSIYIADSLGRETGETITREQRDSLLPHIYYTQLMARDQMPDSIDGLEVSMPVFKHNQWVFSALPRDINKVQPEVFLIMESMPKRIDLEDPDQVFRFRDGRVEFIDMANNSVIEGRSKRFTDIFNDRGFTLPLRSFSANITSRKPYDEGYLMVDSGNEVYHLKMQAGRPYMVRLRKPDSLKCSHVFVMENGDNRHLGFMTDIENRLYIIEKSGYRIIPFANTRYNPVTDRIQVFKSLFNYVVRISVENETRWDVYDSFDYRPLAHFSKTAETAISEKVASYIFPYQLSFTSVSDCIVKPRIEMISWHACFLNILLGIIIFAMLIRRRRGIRCAASCAAITLVFGIFAFIPLIIIKE